MPLLWERKQMFDPHNPFFAHAEWQGWTAESNGQTVGRISAQIDHLNNDHGRPGLGYFGMLEAIDDHEVFHALFDTAESWLSERGKTQVAGPFNLGINQEVGLLVDGFDTPPYFMMGHARPYYDEQIAAAGYTTATDLLAYEMDTRFETPRVMRAMVNRLKKRLVVRPIDRKNLVEDLLCMCGIFNDAWSNNWGYVPFTEEEFINVGKEMLMIIPSSFIQIAEIDGEAAAFVVMLPNVNEAIGDLDGRLLPFGWAKLLWRLKVKYPDSGRVPLMGVKQEFQNTMAGPGLAFAMLDVLHREARANGIERVEMSWILEDNQGVRSIIETLGGAVSKRYRMYEKALT